MASTRGRGLILQHGVDGPPAILGEWLGEREIEHDIHRTWCDPLPHRPGDYGWIATLGSEHTPGAPTAPPWVDAEIEFLSRGLELEIPVLGLCFGGQTLAVAAGGSIVPSLPPEIGWMEIETRDPALVPSGPWLHYHYDLLRPPPESEIVAWSPAGPAAFVLGHSLGLQFHPESTPAIAAEWARQDAKRLTTLGIDPAVLEADGARARVAAMSLFDAWWKLAESRPTRGMGTLSKIGSRADQLTRADEEEHVNPRAAASDTSDAATARETLSPAVGTVRVTYADLHGVQRGKDVPVAELERALRGLAFCWAVMGTDLAHTPVVGGERGYPDMIARPDLSTLRAAALGAGRRRARLADLDARRRARSRPTCAGLVRRAEAGARRARADRRWSAPSWSSSSCEPDVTGGWRRHVDDLSMVYTVGPQADPSGVVKPLLEGCAALGLGAIAANHEFMNSQYEINLPRGRAARRGRRAFRFKSAVKDDAAQRGLHRDVHGQAVQRPGRVGHPPAHLARARRRELLRRRGRRRGVPTELRYFTARGARPRAGADGLPQPDGQRLPADPARLAGPDPRQLGPGQPDDVRARSRPSAAAAAGWRSASATARRTPTW